MTRARRDDDREFRRALERALAPRRRTSVPGALWHWRRELAIVIVTAIMALAVASSFGFAWLIVGLSVLAGLLSPPWSPQLRAWLWQLVTPHLLRSGMFHAHIQNRYGRRPMIMRVTGEAFGERVLLRCPPGLCAEDIDDARETLRAACRAADIRVTRDKMRAHLVTVDVIRWPAAVGRTGSSYPEAMGGGYPDDIGSSYLDGTSDGYLDRTGGSYLAGTGTSYLDAVNARW